MKTSLEVINMSKATSEQQQNSPLEITHLLRAHRFKIKWKVLPFPSYSLFIPTCHQALHCLLPADIFPEGNSTRIPSSDSTYNHSHSSSGFQGDPCWSATVDHSWVLSSKSFITRQRKFSGKNLSEEKETSQSSKIFNSFGLETSQTTPQGEINF